LSVADGSIHDDLRVKFYDGYLTNLRDAVEQDGVDLRSYFAWSFLDNFEWNSGLVPRFGCVYTDYETFERTPKDSAYWLGKVSLGRGKADGSSLRRTSRRDGTEGRERCPGDGWIGLYSYRWL
jgi:beta-glucosidase/6-phospho-beta-glucosidase/beta-galactosidase